MECLSPTLCPPRTPFNVLLIKLALSFPELITKNQRVFSFLRSCLCLDNFSCNLLEAQLRGPVAPVYNHPLLADVTFDAHLGGPGREGHKGLPAMLLLP